MPESKVGIDVERLRLHAFGMYSRVEKGRRADLSGIEILESRFENIYGTSTARHDLFEPRLDTMNEFFSLLRAGAFDPRC